MGATKLSEAKGANYDEARYAWMNSELRATFMKSLSLNELVRRRFVPKGTQTHPWV